MLAWCASDLVKVRACFYFLALLGVVAFPNGMLPFGFYSIRNVIDFFFLLRITAKIYFAITYTTGGEKNLADFFKKKFK